jgi:hypothetical protein
MWLVESLIVDVTPVSRLGKEHPIGDQLQATLCWSDYDEHPHFSSPVATWANVRIAQKKT